VYPGCHQHVKISRFQSYPVLVCAPDVGCNALNRVFLFVDSLRRAGRDNLILRPLESIVLPGLPHVFFGHTDNLVLSRVSAQFSDLDCITRCRSC
jgi:hypothetical protein